MAAAAGAALFGHAQVGELAVGLLHELLQAGLEIGGAGGLRGCGSGPGLPGEVVGAGRGVKVPAVSTELGPAALTLPLGVLGTGGGRGRTGVGGACGLWRFGQLQALF